MNIQQVGERIRTARLAKGLSQEKLAEMLDISFQAVSSWETGRSVPDTEHLTELAKILGVSLDCLFSDSEITFELKPVNFDCERMFTFVKGRAQMLGLPQTLSILNILREAHGNQMRQSNSGFDTSYTVHPLTLACHALAMGLREDDVLAAALAHDMVEDAGLMPEALPVGERVQNAIRLVSKNMCDRNVPDWEDRYYENIRKEPLACLIKCLDRINNLAGMADCFSREKMAEYTAETDRYYPPLLKVLKAIPEWNDAWWLMRYQLNTMTETFKRLL